MLMLRKLCYDEAPVCLLEVDALMVCEIWFCEYGSVIYIFERGAVRKVRLLPSPTVRIGSECDAPEACGWGPEERFRNMVNMSDQRPPQEPEGYKYAKYGSSSHPNRLQSNQLTVQAIYHSYLHHLCTVKPHRRFPRSHPSLNIESI